MQRYLTMTAIALLAAARVALAQSATLTLDSPQNGQSVAPGATIEWTIRFTVSVLDNAGAALVAADLVQEDANPAYFDIPPADAVPAPMSNFSRPAGICNPGERDPVTGYTGVQRGTPGRMNLKQIGGAQNTMGQALPGGSGIAEAADPVGGIGQAGSDILASGSFMAPAAEGIYTFRLQSPFASVMTEVNAPPAFSPVVEIPTGNIDTSGGAISFTVMSTPCDPCDANCDGSVNGADVQPFTLAVTTGAAGGCSACAGDTDSNGTVSLADVTDFVACLLAP